MPMRIHATINEWTLRRIFPGGKTGRTRLTIVDRDLPPFGFTVAKDAAKSFFGRAQRLYGPPKTMLNSADGMTAA